MLEVDGKKYCESIPISIFSAKLAGLYPTDPLEQLQVDEVIAIVDDLWNKIAKTDGKVPETRVAYANEIAPAMLVALASRLRDPFFHGEVIFNFNFFFFLLVFFLYSTLTSIYVSKKPGVADLWVYQYCNFFTSGFFDHIPTNFVSAASPELAAHTAAVKSSDLYVKFGTPE